MNCHITPGQNGWSSEAGGMILAINAKVKAVQAAEEAERIAKQREAAEIDYYEVNNCYPRSLGYFGTETDAHFYER